jgi:hypothetical protein
MDIDEPLAPKDSARATWNRVKTKIRTAVRSHSRYDPK